MSTTPSHGKRPLAVGTSLIAGGAICWFYLIGIASKGGRGAIDSNPLTSIATSAIFAGLIACLVGLVKLVAWKIRSRGSRR
jgi:hypothetical protein